MPNDLTTLSGALLEMKDELIYQLGQKGVTASYSSTDGLLGLIGRISDIQTGGGGSCYHIEFDQASYVAVGGSVTVSFTLQSNYAPLGSATVNISDGSSVYSCITNSSGIGTYTFTNVSDSFTCTASYQGTSTTCSVMLPSLPSQYTQIEYLQSNASASAKVGINTGYILKADDIVEITYSSQATATYESVFGARKNNNDSNSYVFFCRFASSNKSVYGRTLQEKQGSSISLNTKYKVITNQRTCQVYNESGTLLDTISNTGTIEDCVNPCSLFTLNTANGTGYSKDTASHMKIYEFKITDSSGNYKRYMIPVRNGSTGGMYDYITQQFYGESDGRSFTLGSDV